MPAKEEKTGVNVRLRESINTVNGSRSVAALSLGDLLNETFAIYGTHFRRLIILVAIVQVPVSFFGLVPLHGLAGFFVVGAVSLMAGVCIYGATIWAVGQHYVTGEMDIEACYRRVWWRVVSLGALAAGLATLGLLSDFLASTAITGNSAVAGVIVMVLGSAFVVGAVYFMVTPQAVIVEGLRPIEALKRSFVLVRESWWTVFGRGLVVLLVLMGLGLVLTIPFGVASGIAAPEDTNAIGATFVFLAGMVVSVLVPPVTSIAATLLYFDLRVRKEDYDTEALSREMAMVAA